MTIETTAERKAMRKVLGVDIGGTDIKLGIAGEDGSVIESGSIPTMADGGPERAAERVRSWLEERKEGHPEVAAAGIDCAGLVDHGRRHLYYSPNLPGWKDIDLGGLFEGLLALPVTVDNDVNCAAWGEYVLGAGRGTADFICITLGTGIGGGIVLDGEVYRGWQGLAGEIGHQVIDSSGPVCGCGRKGCLEAMANAASIVARVGSLIEAGERSVLAEKGKPTAEEVSRAAEDGDRVAVRALAGAGRALGTGLANLVHLFNPEVIAVGGGVARAGTFLLEPAVESMKEQLLDEVLAAVRVVPAELGNSASFLGAAMMAAGRTG